MAKSKQNVSESARFFVEVRDSTVVVGVPKAKFKATYYKPPGRSHLILRERTKTDDEQLMADAFQAAVAKARELGWIV